MKTKSLASSTGLSPFVDGRRDLPRRAIPPHTDVRFHHRFQSLEGKMNVESQISLVGPGPFDLPVAQSASVEAGSDAATVSFRVLSDPSQVVVVRIAVPNKLLLEFAAALAAAAPKTVG